MLALIPARVAEHYVRLGEIRILSVKPPELSGPGGVINLLGGPLADAALDLVQAPRETAAESPRPC
jgi:hypothetical protein